MNFSDVQVGDEIVRGIAGRSDSNQTQTVTAVYEDTFKLSGGITYKKLNGMCVASPNNWQAYCYNKRTEPKQRELRYATALCKNFLQPYMSEGHQASALLQKFSNEALLSLADAIAASPSQ